MMLCLLSVAQWSGLQRRLRMCLCMGSTARWDCAQSARMVFDLGGYGVLACGHIMHLDCWITYEAYEQGWVPNRLLECPICQARFEGFVCICV